VFEFVQNFRHILHFHVSLCDAGVESMFDVLAHQLLKSQVMKAYVFARAPPFIHSRSRPPIHHVSVYCMLHSRASSFQSRRLLGKPTHLPVYEACMFDTSPSPAAASLLIDHASDSPACQVPSVDPELLSRLSQQSTNDEPE